MYHRGDGLSIDGCDADGHVSLGAQVNKAGKPKAYFYLDPYSRPAEKRGGAWMDEVSRGLRLPSSQLVGRLLCVAQLWPPAHPTAAAPSAAPSRWSASPSSWRRMGLQCGCPLRTWCATRHRPSATSPR